MRMNVVSEGRGMYANALIEKEKDDLTEGDQGGSRGNIKMKKTMNKVHGTRELFRRIQ